MQSVPAKDPGSASKGLGIVLGTTHSSRLLAPCRQTRLQVNCTVQGGGWCWWGGGAEKAPAPPGSHPSSAAATCLGGGGGGERRKTKYLSSQPWPWQVDCPLSRRRGSATGHRRAGSLILLPGTPLAVVVPKVAGTPPHKSGCTRVNGGQAGGRFVTAHAVQLVFVNQRMGVHKEGGAAMSPHMTERDPLELYPQVEGSMA